LHNNGYRPDKMIGDMIDHVRTNLGESSAGFWLDPGWTHGLNVLDSLLDSACLAKGGASLSIKGGAKTLELGKYALYSAGEVLNERMLSGKPLLAVGGFKVVPNPLLFAVDPTALPADVFAENKCIFASTVEEIQSLSGKKMIDAETAKSLMTNIYNEVINRVPPGTYGRKNYVRLIGPCMTITQDTIGGQISGIYINTKKVGSFVASIEDRIDAANAVNYYKDVKAGTHCEIFSANELLLQNSNLSFGHLNVFTIELQDKRFMLQWKEACPRCEVLLDGANFMQWK
jgi:hypothetical protein